MAVRAPAVFILSFDARDALVAAVERHGWLGIGARRTEGLERHFLASGAGIAVIDARIQCERARAAMIALADAIEANGAAALVLLAAADPVSIAATYEAGATQYLAGDFAEAELAQALRFAERHAERVSGHRARRADPARAADPADGTEPSQDSDPLTGLTDAIGARRWLEAAVTGSTGAPALVLLSVSRFEMMNAAFGRGTGDALLRNTARRVERLAGHDGRLVARMAGAEFLVGLPAPVQEERVALLARAIGAAVSRPYAVADELVSLAPHVGVALGEPGEDGAALLRRASAALAEAKAADGDPMRVLSARDEGAAAARGQLEVDLRQALSGGEIAILYQPQISVASGRIVGVEALARWQHPRLGELGAETLFAAAERSDYVVQLSRHIQRQVVAEVAAWPDPLAHLTVAINVTAAEIALPGFADDFCRMLDDGGLARGRVTVEVTESGLIEDLGGAAILLDRLRAGGLSVAIDDFGTGYSSLAYLKALPLDYLKIDRHLSQDIVGSPRDRVVVRGVIDMARSLGLTVVAEGVETTHQLSLLAEEGCNLYQGFIFAPPLDTAALATMVEGWQGGAQAAE